MLNILRSTAIRIRRRGGSTAPSRPHFEGSAEYWERRYAIGGNSGSGSSGRLAAFKASFINDFVARTDIGSVLEFGCGDGSQLALAQYPMYCGVDASSTAVVKCRDRFRSDRTKTFSTSVDFLSAHRPNTTEYDLAISLDVIFHLVEDEAFDKYMRNLCDYASRWIIIYSSCIDAQHHAEHVRHRNFANWMAEKASCWSLTQHVPNPYPQGDRESDDTSFCDFYVYSKLRRGATTS
jgi:SAM-dependent methyltransferase